MFGFIQNLLVWFHAPIREGWYFLSFRMVDILIDLSVTISTCTWLLSSAASADRHKRSKAKSRSRCLRITLKESLQLWVIAVYELLLWTRGSMVVQWLRSLLSFLHWDTFGLHPGKGTTRCVWCISREDYTHIIYLLLHLDNKWVLPCQITVLTEFTCSASTENLILTFTTLYLFCGCLQELSKGFLINKPCNKCVCVCVYFCCQCFNIIFSSVLVDFLNLLWKTVMQDIYCLYSQP